MRVVRVVKAKAGRIPQVDARKELCKQRERHAGLIGREPSFVDRQVDAPRPCLSYNFLGMPDRANEGPGIVCIEFRRRLQIDQREELGAKTHHVFDFESPAVRQTACYRRGRPPAGEFRGQHQQAGFDVFGELDLFGVRIPFHVHFIGISMDGRVKADLCNSPLEFRSHGRPPLFTPDNRQRVSKFFRTKSVGL